MTIKLPSAHKIYPIVVKYSKWPNVRTLQGSPKYPQIGILGLKRNHLATLDIRTCVNTLFFCHNLVSWSTFAMIKHFFQSHLLIAATKRSAEIFSQKCQTQNILSADVKACIFFLRQFFERFKFRDVW
jgi:hypothetical protein